jgi:hypothetical protein
VCSSSRTARPQAAKRQAQRNSYHLAPAQSETALPLRARPSTSRWNGLAAVSIAIAAREPRLNARRDNARPLLPHALPQTRVVAVCCAVTASRRRAALLLPRVQHTKLLLYRSATKSAADRRLRVNWRGSCRARARRLSLCAPHQLFLFTARNYEAPFNTSHRQPVELSRWFHPAWAFRQLRLAGTGRQAPAGPSCVGEASVVRGGSGDDQFFLELPSEEE